MIEEAIKNIKKKGTITLKDMEFEVRITSVKSAYGRILYEVTPIAGTGSTWIEKITIQ